MRTLKSRQTGASLMMTLYLVGTAALIVMCVVKIGPHYYNDRLVGSALEGITDDPGFEDFSKAEVKLKLQKSFQLNSIYHVGTKDIKVKRDSDKLVVDIDYIIIVPVIANVEVKLNFKNHLEHP